MFKTHPLHPAIVHFPIAFLTFSHTLDLLHYLTTVLPLPLFTQYLTPIFPQLLSTSRLLHTLGLISAIPAILSGIVQASAQASKPGNLYEKDGKTIKKKFYIMALHAGLNDFVVILSGWSWWGRFKDVGLLGQSVPEMKEVVMAAVALPVLFYTAGLGGDLVYRYGMGLSAGKGKKEE